MPIFLNRNRRGPDRWLRWKVGLFVLGAACGLVGMSRGWNWLVLVAIAVLLVGVGLRFLGGRSQANEEPEADG